MLTELLSELALESGIFVATADAGDWALAVYTSELGMLVVTAAGLTAETGDVAELWMLLSSW